MTIKKLPKGLPVLFFSMMLFMLVSCSNPGTARDGPDSEGFSVESLVKTDIGQVLEIHVREARLYLRELMLKLYKRNPRELKKSELHTAQENIVKLFDLEHNWKFPELQDKQGVDAINMAFSDDYQGDRVFCFMAGLTSMIMASYQYKTEFYLLQSVDPQGLYNSARNIEIAVWKLGHDRGLDGEPYLYSNSLAGEVSNLSYERLFGKLIGLQDTIAHIIANKTGRTITKVIQQMATAVFLPIF